MTVRNHAKGDDSIDSGRLAARGTGTLEKQARIDGLL
jgi:hypothetical protein